VAWNTTHGFLFYDSIQKINYLGDHFSPIHLVLAAVYRLWENAATLLIIQSIAIGLAATALYLLSLKCFNRKWPAIAITILFLFNPYLHRVSTFDFHPIAFAIPIFLWMLYCIESERYISVVALALLAVTVEETLLPPLVGLGVYIALFHKRWRGLGLIIAILSTGYFVLELTIWMPFFLKEARLTHIGRYANLGGNTLDEIVFSLLKNPFIFFREMVVPFQKVTSLGALFLSVGFLPLLAPRQLILLVLPISSILVSGYWPSQWHFVGQYSSTSLPFLFFGAVYGLRRLHGLPQRLSTARASLWSPPMVKAVCIAFVLFIGYNLYRSPRYVERWSKMHVEAIQGLMREIPQTASVCANQNFIPHLINRRDVSVFAGECIAGFKRLNGDSHDVVETLPLPRVGSTRFKGWTWDIHDAEYVLVELKGKDGRVTWPLSMEESPQAVADILQSKAYSVLKEREGVALLSRPTSVEDAH